MNSSDQLKIVLLIFFVLLKIRLRQFCLIYSFKDVFTAMTLRNVILFEIGYETSEHQLDNKFNNIIKSCVNAAQEISGSQ